MPEKAKNRDEPATSNSMPPDHIGILVASLTMIVCGWWGLYALVTTTLPRVGQRWLFFLLLHIAITGTMIPLVRFVNVRLTPIHAEPPTAGIIIRQATWIGLFLVTAAWLQIPRALTTPIAFALALVFIVIEFFLRLRERNTE